MKFDKRLKVDEKKLLIPETNTVGLIMQRIRDRYLNATDVHPSTGMFLFFSTGEDQRLFPVTSAMGDIWKSMGEPTRIQIDVAVENTFGGEDSHNHVTSLAYFIL
jgi:hypothetical protein